MPASATNRVEINPDNAVMRLSGIKPDNNKAVRITITIKLAIVMRDCMVAFSYAATTAAKRKATKAGKQFSKQPTKIASKTRKYRKTRA